MAAYYPRKVVTIKDVKTEFGPELTTWDVDEEARFEYIEEYGCHKLCYVCLPANVLLQTQSSRKE